MRMFLFWFAVLGTESKGGLHRCMRIASVRSLPLTLVDYASEGMHDYSAGSKLLRTPGTLAGNAWLRALPYIVRAQRQGSADSGRAPVLHHGHRPEHDIGSMALAPNANNAASSSAAATYSAPNRASTSLEVSFVPASGSPTAQVNPAWMADARDAGTVVEWLVRVRLELRAASWTAAGSSSRLLWRARTHS